MASVGLEILWSPAHEDKFVAWCPDLLLYEIGPLQELPVKGSPSCIQTSETTQAVLLATNSSYRYARCVDIHPKRNSDILLAVGLANGKVSLTSFGVSTVEAVGREFAPVVARQCNSVLWNHWETNIFAAALDRSRADSGVVLWDAFGCQHAEKPIREFGFGDSGNSLAWLTNQTLAVGINNKFIKVMDRRDGSTAASTQTKAVNGISVSPHNDDLLVSFFDTQICVWDLRNFEKPITTAYRQKPVLKIAWCPTRHNLLGCLQRDSLDIVLYDLQLTAVGNEEVEPTLLERSIQPAPSHKLTSFSWHPTIESRLLTISPSGNVTDYHVLERITLNWFPSSNLVWTHGRRTMKVISDRDPIYYTFDDLSIVMRRRALNDYGLRPELWQNGEIAEDDSLKHLWHWLHTTRSLVEDGNIKSSIFHPGLLTVLSQDRRSEVVNPTWHTDVAWPPIKVYKSEDRDSALQLCGWRYDRGDLPSLNIFLESVYVDGAYTRAAAIAVFNLRLAVAIDILNRGANFKNNAELRMVAMALSGFPGEAWKAHCGKAGTKIPDPYLRASFAFLTAENDKYDAVLNESQISVPDRVAFACSFLSDAKLFDFLFKLSDNLVEEGNLEGILLTGASPDGVKLLQRFLDKTGDVQSVSLLAVRAFPHELQQDPNVINWIRSYQGLLDCLKLWGQRAYFDIALNDRNGGEKINQQVFISCNFCQKSICSYVKGIPRARSVTARMGPTTSHKVNMSSCPNCRKPLPRCAICMMHVGSPLWVTEYKLSHLASWFTWCQTCRHGGHMDHIQQWFVAHTECPVTGCTCKCLNLDGATVCS